MVDALFDELNWRSNRGDDVLHAFDRSLLDMVEDDPKSRGAAREARTSKVPSLPQCRWGWTRRLTK